MLDKPNLKSQVETFLKDYPKARNCFTSLWLLYLKRFHPYVFTGHNLLIPSKLLSVPREGHTTRVCALIQHNKNAPMKDRYPPTEWGVAKARGFEEESWRFFIASQQPEIKDQLNLV